MDRNITPIVWWQFTNPNLQSERLYSRYKLIVQGRHDKYIRQWARELKAASARHGNRRIGVRFAHEAAGPWFPWSIRKFDNSAANYKGAWRHLHKQFATVGALVVTYGADEAFFSGTAVEVTPIRQIDHITIGNGGCGPLTKRIQSSFFGLFNGETEDKYDWLSYV